MAKSRTSKPVASVTPITAAKPIEAPKRPRNYVSDSAVARSRMPSVRTQNAMLRALGKRTFKPALPMPGVVPPGARIAQDEAFVPDMIGWAADTYFASAVQEGTVFLGYSYLAALSQRAEYRVVSDTIAAETTREWIEIKSSGDDKKKAKIISEIEAEFERLEVQEVCTKAIEDDGLFGRAHIYLDTGLDTDDKNDQEELRLDLGDGRNAASKAKVSKEKPLIALRTIEPMWAYPNRYNSTNPLKANWFKPDTWFVQGKEVHSSRLLLLVGRPVSDILKPAYGFGGLSMSQMLKPYVDNWLRTRQSVSDLVHSFAVSVLKTNLDVATQAGEDNMFRRVDLFNNFRDNRNCMVLDKDTEDFATIQTSLGGLDQLQAQAQEQMAAISRIPIVKLLGIDPHGLNASSEGSLRTFYDWIEGFRKRLLLPILRRILGFVQLSLYGRIDPDIIVDFKPLWQLDETAQATLEQTKAQTHNIYTTIGAVDANEVRETLRNDKESPYASLELEGDAPGPAQPEMPGMGEDPFGPQPGMEQPGEDVDRADTWRRKAAALFDDEDDLHYWADRAHNLFGERVAPNRWSALAAKLAETTNEPEDLEVWEHRARYWSDRAEEIQRRALEQEEDGSFDVIVPSGANVVEFPPVSEYLTIGNPYTREDEDGIVSRSRQKPIRDHRWRNKASELQLANDYKPDTWSEEQHPRDKSGKFAKKGMGSPTVKKVLEKHGYVEHPDFPDMEVYHHPETNHHIVFQPNIKSTSVKVLPPNGKPSGWISSSAKIDAHLAKLHGGQEKKEPETEAPQSGGEAIKVPDGLELIGSNAMSGAKTYKVDYGTSVSVKTNGEWAVFDPDTYNVIQKGKGQEDFDAALKDVQDSGSGAVEEPVYSDPLDKLSLPAKDKLKQMPAPVQEVVKTIAGKGYDLQAASQGLTIKKDGKPVASVFHDGTWGLFNKTGTKYKNAGSASNIANLEGAIEEGYVGSSETKQTKQLEAPYPGSVTPPKGLKKENTGEHDTGVQYTYYTDDKGNSLEVSDDGNWWLANSEGEIVSDGEHGEYDQEELNSAFEKLHPRGEGGKFAKKPSTEVAGEQEAAPYPGSVTPPAGFKEKGKGSVAGGSLNFTEYEDDNGNNLKIFDDGDWVIKDPSGEVKSKGSKGPKGQAKLNEAAASATAPPPTPVVKHNPVGEAIDPDKLNKIGDQKGSNPGGVYEDPDSGKKYYVKQTKSEDHAKNELLAARLYGLAGAPTLNYHPAGEKGVATDWENLSATKATELSEAQKKQARLDFATHAWLANWDAVGLNNDNLGAKEDGTPVNLDLGGALQYRAQGSSKATFGNDVYDWDTIRDPEKNANAAAFFKDMTAAEIAESASRVAKISKDDIKSAVAAAGYTGEKATKLANKLIYRQADLIDRSKKEFAAKTSSIKNYAPPLQTNNSAWGKKYKERLDAAPQPNKAEAAAITKYSGGSYAQWNEKLRSTFGKDPGPWSKSTEQLDSWLSKASFPEDGVVKRRVSANYAEHLIEEAESYAEIGGLEHGQHQFDDHGYISTDHWEGSLTMEIRVPKGARAAAIGYYSSHPSENEILIARGSKFRVDGFDHNTMTLKVSLIRSGPAKGGIWHIDPKKG